MGSPRELRTKKSVRLIFVGGFLGSGKTTALAALARQLIQRGMQVGIITNDQTENLVDTLIVKEMLKELGVPVEEVVEGCFCCKFDDLINQMEKVLAHDPDIMMGEPVGSCTDFVAAVANPIKIHYQDSFRFAPFSTLVDPERVRELLLGESRTSFPEEVSYLFRKQLEEADMIVLNKKDLLEEEETKRLLAALSERYADKRVMAASAKEGDGMQSWLELLLAESPGANTVLRQIDYDRYAKAEAVLGWLNAAIKLSSPQPFESADLAQRLTYQLIAIFQEKGAEIGHVKFVITSGGKAMWVNLTSLAAAPIVSGESLGKISKGSLILNARVRLEPAELEAIVRESVGAVFHEAGIQSEVIELQCFSPAYPQPPYLVRENPD